MCSALGPARQIFPALYIEVTQRIRRRLPVDFILGEPTGKQSISVQLNRKGKDAPKVDAFWMGRADPGKLIGLHHLRMLCKDLFNLVGGPCQAYIGEQPERA